jgi:hypothetical protein
MELALVHLMRAPLIYPRPGISAGLWPDLHGLHPGCPRTVSRFDYCALPTTWLTEPVVIGIPPTRHSHREQARVRV